MIAVDWGTSSLRAWRLDGAGAVVEQRRSALGVLACDARFEETLAEQIAGWDDELILLCGMIGSRQGWREVPYLECPAGIGEIAAAMLQLDSPALCGRRIWIAPGLVARPPQAAPDVMRGEETQVCGLPDLAGGGARLLCLPGTHNKWVHLNDGCVLGFSTAMTGEVFAMLKQHSILGRLMVPSAEFDLAAFEQGLDAVRQPGGLLHHLFGTRTLGLLGGLAAAQLDSYLSGLLIGQEVQDLAPEAGCVDLIGSASLTRLYRIALTRRGIGTREHSETTSATGLWRLAQARAWV